MSHTPLIDAAIGRRRTGEHGENPDEARADVLSDPYVRAVIAVLASADGSVSVSDLARGVAALITDEPPDTVPRAVPRRIQTWLHHGHLPTLVEYGIVTYDPHSGAVRLLDRNPFGSAENR